MWRLHARSGLGVAAPPSKPRTNGSKTACQYSRTKSTSRRGMSRRAATARASRRSRSKSHAPPVSSASSQLRISTPVTSYPARLRSQAATALSTPPLRPTATRGRGAAGGERRGGAATRATRGPATRAERIREAPTDRLAVTEPEERSRPAPGARGNDARRERRIRGASPPEGEGPREGDAHVAVRRAEARLGTNEWRRVNDGVEKISSTARLASNVFMGVSETSARTGRERALVVRPDLALPTASRVVGATRARRPRRARRPSATRAESLGGI